MLGFDNTVMIKKYIYIYIYIYIWAPPHGTQEEKHFGVFTRTIKWTAT